MEQMKKLRRLVNGFRENLKNLKDDQTPEAVIRQEYIDEFWKLLGWDVNNAAHRSLAQKDVVIEATVGTIEGTRERSRRPDYLFRIGGFPRFIVEAKRPSVDVFKDKDAIFQAKTYAWSAQIPFAILTNFERFRLFDTTIKPYYDEAGKGLVVDFDLRFEDYEEQWDVLCKTFGREAVAEGSLESLLASIKKVRKGRRIRGIDRMLIDLKGSEPVDRAFLGHLEQYRLRFAQGIYRDNKKNFPEANTRHGAARLTEATQRLIDRIVFIRVCEDRNITSYGRLRDIVNHAAKNRLELYDELVGEFRNFDQKYNGYLFKAHFSEDLTISGDLLADFVRTLYLPDGPYRFDAIGDDLLGVIYERFLGSVITVWRGEVRAEEKPEVRHAGGVYYTPKFVVDTIVRRVVGPKLEGKTPEEVLNINILDPACGSGSFLIAALQYVYDHCVHCFEKNPKLAVVKASPKARTKTKKIGFKDEEGNWHLMPAFKGQILASCIYGVDIDGQAVEVTIMSLYLKMLEGKLPKNWQKDFLQSRLLPSLDNNIRCGNSLISQTDFDIYWERAFNDLFGGDKEVKFRMNPFDWRSRTRGFGRIFDDKKGFDCIIGNPPYIRVQELKKWASEECEFYKANYESASKGNYDIYVIFIEKGLSLLAPNGFMGYICPNKFWTANYGINIRNLINTGKHINEIIDFSDQQVFRGVTTYTAIQIFTKTGNEEIKYRSILNLVDGEKQIKTIDNSSDNNWNRFNAFHPKRNENWIFRDQELDLWCQELEKHNSKLTEISSEIFVGLQTSADTVFLFENYKEGPKHFEVFSKASNSWVKIEAALLKRVVRSGQIGRYWARSTAYVLFPYSITNNYPKIISEKSMKSLYPFSWEYLKSHEVLLRGRESGKFNNLEWYGLMRKNLDKWDSPKIMIPYMVTELSAYYDEEGDKYFVNVTTGGFGIRSNLIDEKLLTAYLSSSLLDKWFKAQAGKFHGGYFGANKQYIENLPIKIPKTKAEIALATKIQHRVKMVSKLKEESFGEHLSDREKESFSRQIESHQSQIDSLVLELYGVGGLPE
ncbi:MAG: hypothetical protein DRP66_03225 [Planctomycetota bacterium]|nr:MAG: hypothetical protein DRP66_03225 [Planctomycetota bacterium]